MYKGYEYLVENEVVTEEDARILYGIEHDLKTEVSLLDLHTIHKRLSSYLKSTTNKNKRTLYLGLLDAVQKCIDEWGTIPNTQYLIT